MTSRTARALRLRAAGVAAVALAMVAAMPVVGASAEPAEHLDVSYSGSFSSGNSYTAATGETLSGRLTRRTGEESLDVTAGLVLGGGRQGAGFEPTDVALGSGTIDEPFVVEAEFIPAESQTTMGTLLAVGGNFTVRYQGGKLRYGFDTNLGGSWASRVQEVDVPEPGTSHVISVAYLPDGDAATVIAYLDGVQLPTVEPTGGKAALSSSLDELVGIGNEVHPAGLTRGFVGSIRRSRFATVSGPFSPTMIEYQQVDNYVKNLLQVSFSGTLASGTYQTGTGEKVVGDLAVRGGVIEQPGMLELAGPDSGLTWDSTALGAQALGQPVLAEAVIGPDVLTGDTTLVDLAGGVRLERAGPSTVKIIAGDVEVVRELPAPTERSGLTFHHLGLLSDLDSTGAGTITLLAAGGQVGDPVDVTGVTASRDDVRFLLGASGTAYGLAISTGAGVDDQRLGQLPCTASTIDPAHRISITKGECAASVISKASAIRPTERQVSWQEAEQTAFLHFGMNTFTGQEWGHGDEDPDLFQPSQLDTDQWARTLRDNGFRYAILTVKHHDGFVLYPSRYTDHDVASSSWRDGNGDVLEMFTKSAHRYGLKVGVYLSPADWNQYHKGVFANGSARTERTIPTLVPGDDRAGRDLATFTYDASDYGAYFLNQLYEVLTEYGEVDEVWFDGADGGIPDAGKETYDFAAYYDLIRHLAPQATIAVSGPDVRWVGNENGLARENEWSPVPVGDNDNGGQHVVPSGTAAEIGTDDALAKAARQGARELTWWPAEVDVSIRPGWFYHENQQPKSVDALSNIYYSSVGRNSVLLLNIPPNREGKLPATDVARLGEWNADLRRDFPHDLALGADTIANGEPATEITDGTHRTSWQSERASAGEVTIRFGSEHRVDRLILNEDIADGGQQVRSLAIDARAADGSWQQVATTGTVGYQRIVRLPSPVDTDALRIRITSSRGPVHLASVSAYGASDEPVEPRSTYFVDCDAARAGEGSIEQPISSLNQLRELNLPAGSTVRFKRGTTCDGSLEVWGYGTSESPALLTGYGAGTPAALSGPGNDQAIDQLKAQGWKIRGAFFPSQATSKSEQ
ncbi:MAG TPA: alpha-L-fucosidase [Nocardioidaceae bacterium]|nr:alpha-L-fucosidase [Nocardioidaceae bacterium]